MCTADSVAKALRMTRAGLDYLIGPGAGELNAVSSGAAAAWLMAMTSMTRPEARAEVRRMRLLRDHPDMADALADAGISKSMARAIAEWTRKLPAELRAETIRILVQAGTTFGGAGVIRGNLTPECAAAVQAVLEALGKKAGAEDTRTEGRRFRDALQQGCELLIGAKMVPDRAGADTYVAVHIPFGEESAYSSIGSYFLTRDRADGLEIAGRPFL